MIWLLMGFLLSLLYLGLLLNLSKAWASLPEPKSAKATASTSISIVIPARNEANNIRQCIDSLLAQDYNAENYEIIVIDDHSEDDTALLLQCFQSDIKYEKALLQGKKHALSQGVNLARYECILTLDADCTVGNQWLSSWHDFILNGYEVGTGRIVINPINDLLSLLEANEVDATMALTKYGIGNKKYYLANGANFYFKKSIFKILNGYNDNLKYASGDDVFFINKAANAGFMIGYNASKNGIVATYPKNSWTDLLHQRKRWATKANAIKNNYLWTIQVLIVGICAFILLGLCIGILVSQYLLVASCGTFILKLIFDYIFLNKINRHDRQLTFSMSFILASMLYPFLMIAMSIWALWPSKFVWKNRELD